MKGVIPQPGPSIDSPLATTATAPSGSADRSSHPSWRQFLEENGWLLLLSKLCTVPPRRVRDALLSRRLSAPGLRLGRAPRLLGLRHMRLGRHFNAGNDLWLEAVTRYGGIALDPLLVIGDDCNLSDQVHIACAHRVEIGAGLLCGSRVLISDHGHGCYGGAQDSPQSSPDGRPATRRLSNNKSVHIGRNVWLGDGVAVLGGASIGDGSVIGANAVVTGAIPPRTIAVGAPARPIRTWNDEHKRWLPSSGPALIDPA